MATKTISIELDVYERLKALRTAPSESFSQVLRRSLPVRAGLTGAEILSLIESGRYPKVGWSDREIETMEEIDSTFLPEGRDSWK